MQKGPTADQNHDAQETREHRMSQFVGLWARAAVRRLESAAKSAQVYAQGLFADREEGVGKGKELNRSSPYTPSDESDGDR